MKVNSALNVAQDPTMLVPAQATTVTLPAGQLCHYIRDDELDRLGEMRSDLVMEICLASAGLFFGSIVPAFDGFRRFGASTNPTTGTDLLSMMLCFAAGVVALITGLQWRSRSKLHKGMVAEIRDRPKVPVRLAHDNP
jgi:hypothetical protein